MALALAAARLQSFLRLLVRKAFSRDDCTPLIWLCSTLDAEGHWSLKQSMQQWRVAGMTVVVHGKVYCASMHAFGGVGARGGEGRGGGESVRTTPSRNRKDSTVATLTATMNAKRMGTDSPRHLGALS